MNVRLFSRFQQDYLNLKKSYFEDIFLIQNNVSTYRNLIENLYRDREINSFKIDTNNKFRINNSFFEVINHVDTYIHKNIFRISEQKMKYINPFLNHAYAMEEDFIIIEFNNELKLKSQISKYHKGLIQDLIKKNELFFSEEKINIKISLELSPNSKNKLLDMISNFSIDQAIFINLTRMKHLISQEYPFMKKTGMPKEDQIYLFLEKFRDILHKINPQGYSEDIFLINKFLESKNYEILFILFKSPLIKPRKYVVNASKIHYYFYSLLYFLV